MDHLPISLKVQAHRYCIYENNRLITYIKNSLKYTILYIYIMFNFFGSNITLTLIKAQYFFNKLLDPSEMVFNSVLYLALYNYRVFYLYYF